MPVEKGNTIKVEYTGTLDDGTVFDSSEKHGQPLEFKVGEGSVIKGVDDAVVGMQVEEEKDVHVKSEDAYGEPNEQLKQTVPRDKMPEMEEEIKPGMVLVAQTPDGKKLPATVVDVNDSEITLDLNHPLAGKDLNFKLKITEISEGEEAPEESEEASEENPEE